MEIKPNSEQDQFKADLFEKFKESGLLHDLKAKMRHDLLAKLNANKENTDSNIKEAAQSVSPTSFQSKLLNNLVCEYLKSQNFNYSYSIFANETKLSLNNMLSKEEITQYFAKNSLIFHRFSRFPAYKYLESSKSLLEIILEILYDRRNLTEFANVHTQTEESQDFSQESLKKIDENFLNKMNFFKLNAISSAEEQISQYKRNLQERFQADLESEVQKVREYEVASVKYEENLKFQRKFEEFRKEQDRKYLENTRKIKEREENALKLCKAKISEIDRKDHENRQILLKELEKLKTREKELLRHNCLEHQEVMDERQKLKNLQEELAIKVKEFEKARESLEKQTLREISQRKFDQSSEIERKSADFLRKELEREREFARNCAETLKNYEKQREYATKDNDFLTRENKDLENLRLSHEETINMLRTTVNSLKSQVDAQNRAISAKNCENQEKTVEMREKDQIIREMRGNIERLRAEATEMLANHEKTVEKYRGLVKQLRESQRKTKKTRESLIDVEKLEEGDDETRENRSFQRKFGDFFDKIREIKKKREIFEDFAEIEAESAENRAEVDIFKINAEKIEKKRDFLSENIVSQRDFQEKPEILQLPEKKHAKTLSIEQKIEDFKENSAVSKDLSSFNQKPAFFSDKIIQKDQKNSEKSYFQEKRDNFIEKRGNFFENRETFIEKPETFIEKSDKFIEKRDNFVEKSDTFSEKRDNFVEKTGKRDNYIEKTEKRDNFFENRDNFFEKPDNFIENNNNFIEKPAKRDIFFENRDNFFEKRDDFKEKSDNFIEKRESLYKNPPEKTKTLEKTEKISDFPKKPEKKSDFPSFSHEKAASSSENSLFLKEIPRNKEKSPAISEKTMPKPKEIIENEPLKLNFFEKPLKNPSKNAQNLPPLENLPAIPSKTQETSDFSKKSPENSTKVAKIAKKDENFDDFDDLLGELEQNIQPKLEKPAKSIENLAKIEKNSAKSGKSSENLGISEKKAEKPGDLFETKPKVEFIHSMEDFSKEDRPKSEEKPEKSEEFIEEIEEEIDFGE